MNSIVSATAVVLFASWMSNALAGNSQTILSSGTINFQGSIVESPCTTDTRQNRINVSCERSGQKTVQTLDLQSLGTQQLANNLAETQINWLDAQRKSGILTISYR